MSASRPGAGHWTGHDPGARAERVVADAVRRLCRARLRQSLVQHAAAGLCLALLAAGAAVLAIRLGVVPWPPVATVAALLLAALLGACVAAWLRRADPLAVAIDADLRLNLQQRLSTAYELVRRDEDGELARRLAAQAVRARLPGRSVSVFPPQVGALGLLAPVAAILLALVSIVDLDHARRPQPAAVDRSVAAEGLRLREYGQRMAARARRDELARSGEAAARLEQLGTRMHAGTLQRAAALERLGALDRELDEQARAALARGPQTEVGPLRMQRMGGPSPDTGASARELLRRLDAGELGEGDLEALAARAAAAGGAGSDALAQAIERFRDGESGALREMLEQLSGLERDARDAAELERARERLSRAREALGDPTAGRDSAAAPQAGAAGEGGREAAAEAGGSAAQQADDEAAMEASGPGLPGGSAGARSRAPSPSPSIGDGPALEVQAVPGERGEVFQSEARALPRAGSITTLPATLSPRFRPQLEEVLADDRVPATRKELVKRYFLRLGDDAAREPERP